MGAAGKERQYLRYEILQMSYQGRFPLLGGVYWCLVAVSFLMPDRCGASFMRACCYKVTDFLLTSSRAVMAQMICWWLVGSRNLPAWHLRKSRGCSSWEERYAPQP